jgi:hypothetical protein
MDRKRLEIRRGVPCLYGVLERNGVGPRARNVSSVSVGIIYTLGEGGVEGGGRGGVSSGLGWDVIWKLVRF